MTDPSQTPAATPPKSSKDRPAKAPEGPPVPIHATAPDIVVTGIGLGEKPESDAQKEAREFRERYGHVGRQLMAEGFGVNEFGARLLTAHMVIDLGAKLADMKPDALSKYTRDLRARYPYIWGPAAVGDIGQFVGRLKVAGLRPDVDWKVGDLKAEQDALGSVIREYQHLTAKLTPPSTGFGT